MSVSGLWRWFFICASLVASCSAAASPGQEAFISGRVKNALDGSAISGVRVVNLASGKTATTDTQGRYKFEEAQAEKYVTNVFTAHHPDWTVPIRWIEYIGSEPVTLPDFALYPESPVERVTDTFNRPDNSVDLGKTEGEKQYPWQAGTLRSACSIRNQALVLARQESSGDGVSIGNLMVSDFDAEFVIRSIAGSGFAMICFRQDPSKGNESRCGQYGWGMALRMDSSGKKVSLGQYWYGSPVLVKEVATSIDWSKRHTIRIRAQRYCHSVWLDGERIIDDWFCYFDQSIVPHSEGTSALCEPGYIGLYRGQDTSLEISRLSIDVLGVPKDPDEQEIAAIEARYRASKAYAAEGARYLESLAKASSPNTKRAALGYLSAGKLLLLANDDTSTALPLLKEAAKLSAPGDVVGTAIAEIVEKFAEKAKRLGNDLAGAIANWEYVYELEKELPNKTDALVQIAIKLIVHKDYSRALTYLNRVLTDPAVVSDKRALGVLYQEALELSASAQFAVGDSVDAAKTMEEIKSTLSRDATLEQKIKHWNWIASIYFEAKRYREAINTYKEVRQYKDAPREAKAEAMYRSGLCYQAIGLSNSARRCMDEVAKKYSDSSWAKKARGLLYVWENYGSNGGVL